MKTYLLFFLFCATFFLAQANTYYVANGGDDTADGSLNTPWATIQKAANTLIPGDTVFIRQGSYPERIIFNVSGTAGNYIVFTNYPNENPIINGAGISWGASWNGLLDLYDKHYIEISGLTIKSSDYTGIFLENSSNIVLKNNVTDQTYSSGIGVWDCHDVTIRENEVIHACQDGNQECISVSNTYNCYILKNHVHHNGNGDLGGEGIDVKQGAHDVWIYENYVHDTNKRIGIYVDAWNTLTHDIEIYGNVVHNCGNAGFMLQTEMGGELRNIKVYNNISYHNKFEGFVVGDVVANDSVTFTPVHHIDIINNTSYQNGTTVYGDTIWGYGILVHNDDAHDIIIRNNISSENDAQIAVELTTNNIFVDHNLLFGDNLASGCLTGTDAILENPSFVDASVFDFHLQHSSPAINVGNADKAPSFDFDNNPRPFDGAVDLGAYEHQTPLPVEIIGFHARQTPDGMVSLNWITESEINNDYFILEKSKDGQHWNFLSKVIGIGNTTQAKAYQVFDSAPFLDLTYYRLTQVDFDGFSQKLGVVSIQNTTGRMEVYPNLFRENFTIKLKQSFPKDIQVFDCFGHDVTHQLDMHFHANKIQVSAANLKPGMYWIIGAHNAVRVMKQ